jgi:hypothetical protein
MMKSLIVLAILILTHVSVAVSAKDVKQNIFKSRYVYTISSGQVSKCFRNTLGNSVKLEAFKACDTSKDKNGGLTGECQSDTGEKAYFFKKEKDCSAAQSAAEAKAAP